MFKPQEEKQSGFKPQPGDYVITGTVFHSSLQNSRGGNAQTALFGLRGSHGTECDGYCCDFNTCADSSKYYHDASPNEIKELFAPQLVSKLRMIINHSYPVVCDAEYLGREAGTDGLSTEDIIAGTQAAIWNWSNPEAFSVGCENPENLQRFASYLIGLHGEGWEMEDVEKRCREAKVGLDECDVRMECCGDTVTFGPYRLESSCGFLKRAEFTLKLRGINSSRVRIIDRKGCEVCEVKPGEEFYFTFERCLKVDCLALEVCTRGQVTYGADVSVIAALPIRDSQAICRAICKKREMRFCFDLDLSCRRSVMIVKYDKHKPEKKLCGAKFEISADKRLIDTVITGDDGTAISKQLRNGCYELTEICAPEGYEKDCEPIRFCIGGSGRDDDGGHGREDREEKRCSLCDGDQEYCLCEPLVIYVCNEKKKRDGCIKIIKYDKCCESKKLEGAKFLIAGENFCREICTDRNGEAEICRLDPGFYAVLETVPPKGYMQQEKPFFVSLRPGETECLRIANQKNPEKPKGTIKLYKTDSECECQLLGGAEFDIFDCEGEKVGSINTVAGEPAYSCPLPLGIYRLCEVCAPECYKPLFAPVYVNITSSAEFTAVTIPNERKKSSCTGMFRLSVRGAGCGGGICGSEWRVYDSDGNESCGLVTDKSGEARSDSLPCGEYRLINTCAPEGCQRIALPYYVTVSCDQYIPCVEILV